jgi:predicted TIM-barrel fold metal-dependent hydrolase
MAGLLVGRATVFLVIPFAVANAQQSAPRSIAPLADHHQHLFSPAAAAMQSTPTRTIQPITARDLIALLDSAGIQKALVLSVAYTFGRPDRQIEDEQAKVRAENDWTAAQVSQYPDRLFAACSVNPIKEYALDEIARCAKDPVLRRALKLHFGNSDVRTDSARQLEQLKRVFRAANDNRTAIVVHMHANINNARPYGTEQARVFLTQLLPLVPDVPVQIAHLAGAGGADNPRADSALAVFSDALARNDPRMKNVWFDVTAVIDTRITPANAQRLPIRFIGSAPHVCFTGQTPRSAATPHVQRGLLFAQYHSPRPRFARSPRTCRRTCVRARGRCRPYSIATT